MGWRSAAVQARRRIREALAAHRLLCSTANTVRSYVKVELGEPQISLVARREQHAQCIDDRGLAGVVWANDDIQPVLEAEAEVFKPPESLDTQFIKAHEPIFSPARRAPHIRIVPSNLTLFHAADSGTVGRATGRHSGVSPIWGIPRQRTSSQNDHLLKVVITNGRITTWLAAQRQFADIAHQPRPRPALRAVTAVATAMAATARRTHHLAAVGLAIAAEAAVVVAGPSVVQGRAGRVRVRPSRTRLLR